MDTVSDSAYGVASGVSRCDGDGVSGGVVSSDGGLSAGGGGGSPRAPRGINLIDRGSSIISVPVLRRAQPGWRGVRRRTWHEANTGTGIHAARAGSRLSAYGDALTPTIFHVYEWSTIFHVYEGEWSTIFHVYEGEWSTIFHVYEGE